MTPEQIKLVQESFNKVRPISETASALFYDRLFEIDPSTKPLFKNDLKEQRRKLMQTLGTVVDGLDRPETILASVQKLGRDHVDYGVSNSQYDSVGAALIWTLEQGLGDAFTPEVKEAWEAAYGLLAEIMTTAAAEVSS